jgi:hypothetical protein
LAGLLIHRDGHTVELARTMPVPEEIVSGAGKRVQNATQRAGSAESYCKRYTTLSALGIVVGQDDDGEGGATEKITPAQEKEITELVSELPDRRRQAFFSTYDIGEIGELSKSVAGDALPLLRKAIRELHES